MSHLRINFYSSLFNSFLFSSLDPQLFRQNYFLFVEFRFQDKDHTCSYKENLLIQKHYIHFLGKDTFGTFRA